MKDHFKGVWQNLRYACPDELKPVLYGAALDIKDAHDVTWIVDGERYKAASQLEHGNVRGEVTVGNLRYYFEIADCMPPTSLSLHGRHCIYGIVRKVHNSNGDLGDPGTWTAEESGPLGES